MADPWAQFQDAPQEAAHDDPWAQFADAEAPKPVKRKTSQALGFAEGFMKPLDNAAMALEGGVDLVTGSTKPGRFSRMLGQPSAAEAAAQRQNIFRQAEQTKRPGVVGRVAGELVGTIPAAVATRNPFIAGAAQGALLTDSKDVRGVAGDAATGAALNYFGGKILDTAADAIKPVIEPAVRRLNEAGVKLTPGMVKGGKAMVREDRAMSRPVVGGAIAADRAATQTTFNTSTINEALKPLGVKVPTPIKPGHDQLQFAKDTISDAYDTVIPNIKVKIDSQQFAQNVGRAARNLRPEEQQHLSQIVSNELGTGQLQGQALKDAQGEIRRLASTLGRSQNAHERALGDALRSVDDELSSAMIAQNPQYAPQLQRVNTAYRGYRVVADAASRGDEGIFNTGQLKQAVRRGDFTKNKDATARGQGFMQDWLGDARSVIPARTPDSGTAGRLQAGNLFANARGAADAGLYNLDSLYQQFRLMPRPKAAAGAAKAVKRLKGPASAGLVAASHQRDE